MILCWYTLIRNGYLEIPSLARMTVQNKITATSWWFEAPKWHHLSFLGDFRIFSLYIKNQIGNIIFNDASLVHMLGDTRCSSQVKSRCLRDQCHFQLTKATNNTSWDEYKRNWSWYRMFSFLFFLQLSRGTGPPPEVVINAGDKQPGEINEGQQPDERNQHTNPTKLYILTMSQSSSTRRAIPGKWYLSVVSSLL